MGFIPHNGFIYPTQLCFLGYRHFVVGFVPCSMFSLFSLHCSSVSLITMKMLCSGLPGLRESLWNLEKQISFKCQRNMEISENYIKILREGKSGNFIANNCHIFCAHAQEIFVIFSSSEVRANLWIDLTYWIFHQFYSLFSLCFIFPHTFHYLSNQFLFREKDMISGEKLGRLRED